MFLVYLNLLFGLRYHKCLWLILRLLLIKLFWCNIYGLAASVYRALFVKSHKNNIYFSSCISILCKHHWNSRIWEKMMLNPNMKFWKWLPILPYSFKIYPHSLVPKNVHGRLTHRGKIGCYEMYRGHHHHECNKILVP